MATREGQHNPREMSAGAYPHGSSQDASSGEIRSDIRRTRADMDETVDALADRLRPRHLLDDLLDAFRGSGDGAGSEMKDRAKQLGSSALSKLKNHPMPAALIGAGIAWLIFDESAGDGRAAGRDRPGRWRDEDLIERSGSFVDARTGRPYDESYGRSAEQRAGAGGSGGSEEGTGVLGQVRDKAAQVGQGIASTAGSVASSVADTASSFGGQAADRMTTAYGSTKRGVRQGYDYTRRGVEQALDEYPLAATAAALAAGVLTGLLLPGTRREDELMGEQAKRLMEHAKEKGQEVVQRGKDVAEATVGAASEEARRQGVTPAALADKAKHVAQAITGAAGDAAAREGLTDLPGKVTAVAERAREAAKDKGRQQTDQMKKRTERP